MNTSFANEQRGRVGGARLRRIIARALLALCVLGAVAACTTARLAYNQAPNLSWWWLNREFDIGEAQADQVRGDIDGFFSWHRREELPQYAGLLRQWQAMAVRDVTAQEVCQQFDTIRERLVLASDRMVEPFARLALQLTPDQLAHLRERHADSNAEFASDFIEGTPEQRLERRLDRTVSRTESLYGRLSREQRALLRERLAASPWDPRRAQAERLRRQADLLQTVRTVQARPDQANDAVRAKFRRLAESPTPGHQAANAVAIRHACQQFADLHNSTTPEQRAQAVQVLQGYERDLQVLSAQR